MLVVLWQLNMYDFRKTKPDPNWREFRHPSFRRGHQELMAQMKRKSSTPAAAAPAASSALPFPLTLSLPSPPLPYEISGIADYGLRGGTELISKFPVDSMFSLNPSSELVRVDEHGGAFAQQVDQVR